ncbi:MAG: hypothetical protein QMC67_00335 [Candidatus Wallbacteria bacterium]
MKEIKYFTFYIDNEPYAIVGDEVLERNYDFINQIKTSYFADIVKYIANGLETDENKELTHYKATLIRTLYSQSLETFFALLFATLQAPTFILPWLQKYEIGHLKNLVERIENKQKFDYYKVDVGNNWHSISKLINHFKCNDSEQGKLIIEKTGNFWAKIAKDFLNQRFNEEYNNIKHGFRIVHGGHYLKIGESADKLINLGGSKYGSTVYRVEYLKNSSKKVFHLRRMNFNWDVSHYVNKIELLSISINNVINFVRLLHNVDVKKLNFIMPDIELFNKVDVKKIGGFIFYDVDINHDLDELPKINIDIEALKNDYKKKMRYE